ncbi:MAG: hypothetical protein LBL66_10370 [Clostridiales bacterium]|jgi:hypothetical protein|nr:hypothetical protein [Clostridiales bacterium]
MKGEYYQKVAFIGLRNPDGTMTFNVPLYVKITEVDKNGVPESQRDLMTQISEIMIKRYEKQISAYFTSLKKGEDENETSIVSDGV